EKATDEATLRYSGDEAERGFAFSASPAALTKESASTRRTEVATPWGRHRARALRPVAHQREHFQPGLFVGAKDAPDGGSDRPVAGLLDPSHAHAQVFGFDDDGRAFGRKALHERVGYRRREPLLHLRPPR